MLNILHKKSVGVDIADRTIEVVELVKSAGWAKARSFGRVKLAAGIVEKGRIKDEKKLILALKKAMLSAAPKPIKAKKIIFGLPESQVYTHIFKIKRKSGLSPKELEISAQKEASANIPIRDDRMVFSFRVLFRTKTEIFIVLLAAEKKAVSEWRNFFKNAGLEPEVFDIETLASFRGLDIKDRRKTVCLLDIGSNTTNISIFHKKGLYYSQSVRPAGSDFTARIAKALKTDEDTAEKLKINAGLNKAKEKIYPLLVEGLEEIIKEVKSSVKYFEENFQAPVEEIILIGGGSRLKKLSEHIKASFDLPISLGRSKFFKDSNFEYIEAAGLARRGLDKKWDKKDPAIPMDESERAKIEISPEEAREEEKESDLMLSPEQEEEDKPVNLKRKLILLAIIIFIGVVLVGLAFYWRQLDRQNRQEQQKAQMADYSQEEAEDKEKIEAIQEDEPAENSEGEGAESPEQPESEEADLIQEAEEEEELKPSIIILDTETGYLNARQGPGTGYGIVDRVQPGEVYQAEAQEGSWIKIQLANGEEAWISAKYAEEFTE